MTERLYKIAIDPGLGGTGYCVFTDDFAYPERAGIVSGHRQDSFLHRSNAIAEMLSALLRDHFDGRITDIYIEWPEDFGSAKGHAAAKRGDIFKLVFLTGIIAHVLCANCEGLPGVPIPVRFHPVKVSEWKGQMPKAVTAKRITEILGESWTQENLDNGIGKHDWDAVGIALWSKGLL